MENRNTQTLKELDILLSDYQAHYQNLRHFHWNVKGPFFFVLHDKFEELYNDAATKIDDIAERILALGGTPNGSLKTVLSNAKIDSVDEVLSANEMVSNVIEANKLLMANVNALLQAANDADDEGTLDLFTSYIQELEKQNWMFKSYLG